MRGLKGEARAWARGRPFAVAGLRERGLRALISRTDPRHGDYPRGAFGNSLRRCGLLGRLASRRSPVYAVVVVSQLFGLLLVIPAALLLRIPLPALQDSPGELRRGCAGLSGSHSCTPLSRRRSSQSPPRWLPSSARRSPCCSGLRAGTGQALSRGSGSASRCPRSCSSARDLCRRMAGARCAGPSGWARPRGRDSAFFSRRSPALPGSGLWPLLSARAASILTVLGFALFTGGPSAWRGGRLPLVAAAGLLDMGANIAFLLASRSGMLTIAAVVCSLYSGPTVLLARLVLREKLSWPRIAGLGLGFAGVGLISAGG